MGKRRLFLVAPMAALAVGLSVVLPVARVAYAAAPVQQGWWTVTNPGSTLPVPPPALPGVPPDGLLIQGGVNEPSAYAALGYDLGPDVTAGTLTLAVAPNSASTPGTRLRLCPLTASTFSSQQGGPMAEAPAYDCGTDATAGPNDDGDAYRFSVATMVNDGVLAVAILPVDPVARVVLSGPGESSLATQPVPGSTAPPVEPPAPTPESTPSTEAPAGGGSAGPPVAAGPHLPTGTVATTPPDPVVATAVPSATSVAVQAVADQGDGGSANPAVAFGLLAAVALGAGLWTYAGRSASVDASDPLDALDEL